MMPKNNECIQSLTFSTPLGDMTAFGTSEALTGLYCSDQVETQKIAQTASNTQANAILNDTKEQIIAYFKQQRQAFSLPYRLDGTPFQRLVWQALAGIKFGQTTTYGQLAKVIGRPKAVRAVGQTVSRNPFLIILPCHRVIGSDGSLTGFAAGIERKKALLSLES